MRTAGSAQCGSASVEIEVARRVSRVSRNLGGRRFRTFAGCGARGQQFGECDAALAFVFLAQCVANFPRFADEPQGVRRGVLFEHRITLLN